MANELFVGFCDKCSAQVLGKAYPLEDKKVCAKCAGIKSKDVLICEALEALLRLQTACLSSDVAPQRKILAESVAALQKEIKGE